MDISKIDIYEYVCVRSFKMAAYKNLNNESVKQSVKLLINFNKHST